MPRAASAELIALLAGTNIFWEGSLYTFEFGGAIGTMRWHDCDTTSTITLSALVYSHGPLMSSTLARSTATMEVDQIEIEIHGAGFLLGGKVVQAAAVAGTFDNVKVTVQRLYAAAPFSVVNGGLGVFTGWVSDVKPTSTSVRLTVTSLVGRMQALVPKRPIQITCPFQVGDTFCGVTVLTDTNRDTDLTICTVSRVYLKFGITFTNATVNGVITITSDLSAVGILGMSRTISAIAYDGAMQKWYADLADPFPVAPNNCVITATQGCDQTPDTCDVRFGNMIRFGGFPEMPVTKKLERWDPLLYNNRPPVRRVARAPEFLTRPARHRGGKGGG